jgi:prepilin-type N-terminal cleavage/methylation domain-containing protein
MSTARACNKSGFSLLEVMIALAVLTAGALVALTVMMGTSSRNEQQKQVAIGYKVCQDVMEAMLSMSYSDLVSLRAYQQGPPAQALTFNVTAPGFPRLPGGGYVVGTYNLMDVSNQYGWPANSGKVIEIDVRLDHQNIHCRITARRMQP